MMVFGHAAAPFPPFSARGMTAIASAAVREFD